MDNLSPYSPPSSDPVKDNADTSRKRSWAWAIVGIPLALFVSRITNDLYWDHISWLVPGNGIVNFYLQNLVSGTTELLGGFILAVVMQRKTWLLGLFVGITSFAWWFVRSGFPFSDVDTHFIIHNIYFIGMFCLGSRLVIFPRS